MGLTSEEQPWQMKLHNSQYNTKTYFMISTKSGSLLSILQNSK